MSISLNGRVLVRRIIVDISTFITGAFKLYWHWLYCHVAHFLSCRNTLLPLYKQGQTFLFLLQFSFDPLISNPTFMSSAAEKWVVPGGGAQSCAVDGSREPSFWS
jgi:hypothetical protein